MVLQFKVVDPWRD